MCQAKTNFYRYLVNNERTGIACSKWKNSVVSCDKYDEVQELYTIYLQTRDAPDPLKTEIPKYRLDYNGYIVYTVVFA